MKKVFLIFLISFTFFDASAQQKLWAICTTGGSMVYGTIFSSDSSGNNFSTNFKCHTTTGGSPVGGLCLADNGSFYGITEIGHFHHGCDIFKYTPSTNTSTVVWDFFDNDILGNEAWSKLVKANDGNLYGCCANGGAYGFGTIFKLDPSSDTYTDLFDFHNSDGEGAFGSLIQLSDGKLYGWTKYGGSNNIGTLFCYDISTNTLTNFYSFTNSTGSNPNYGGLVLATNGKLYGTTQSGGFYGFGVIFSYDLTTNTYSDEYDFDLNDGGNPFSGLIIATNGNLYGMCNTGGVNNSGIIFSYNINTNTFSDLHDFNGTDGGFPRRSLIQSVNGKLYGTTNYGGIDSAGVIFSYDIFSSIFTKLNDFSISSGGYFPDCELVETSLHLGISGIPNFNSVIQISPNPFTNSFSVSSSKENIFKNSTKIKIYNKLGEKVFESEIKNLKSEIDLTTLSSGIYFTEIKTDERIYRGKVVKQ